MTINKLNLDKELIVKCRSLAKRIARKINNETKNYTTLTIERTVCRLLGIDGIGTLDIPLPNVLVDEVNKNNGLSLGISRYLAGALIKEGLDLKQFIEKYQAGETTLVGFELPNEDITNKILMPYLEESFSKISTNKTRREQLKETFSKKEEQIYVICATGNIHEDIIQAKAAALKGADIIAVIRSTGQSLLDYVPYGVTTEGFGGTFATQENFRLMRSALDEVSEVVGRYISLVNYASGLCMPEIAAIAALERLDMLLNDSMYGIIFRDINPKRTFIDQHFSRMINAYAGIIINTGEDNYLTTSDALEEAHIVLASQFINEAFAKAAYLNDNLIGLGHAFEIDPEIEDSFLIELSQAQMVREIFPKSPIKYMPPTKHITGDIFRAVQQNTMFNMVSTMSKQSIHLLGMMTEAIHTPFISDRFVAIENATLIQKALKSYSDEIYYKKDGIIYQRAQEVLNQAYETLKMINETNLFDALEKGLFASTKRALEKGKGKDGVIKKDKGYYNIVLDRLERELNEL